MPHLLRPGLALLGTAWLFAACALGACGGERGAPPAPPVTDTGRTALETWESFYVPDPQRIPSELATNPGTPWGPYAGSRACESCHPVEYGRWRRSFHSRTLYDAVPETIFGDFSERATFDDPKSPYHVEPFRRRDEATGRDRHYMRIRWRRPEEGGLKDRRLADTYGNGLPEFEDVTVEVIYAFGNRRHQPYVARWPDGKHWVVPIYWNDVSRRWLYDGFRPYVESCAPCHVTGIQTSEAPERAGLKPVGMSRPARYNLPPDREGWADGAVGCEVCHGPGLEHVKAVEKVGRETYRRMRAAGEKGPTIFDGASESLDRRISQCGQCHDFFTESTLTWVPGPHGFDRDPAREPLSPATAKRGEWQFYADGSTKSPCTMREVYRKSKMYAKEVGCGDCHDPHGTDDWADLRLPLADNQLCLSCHQTLFPTPESQTAHSRHRADSPGNRCAECHMPRHLAFTNGVQLMSDRIFKHSFEIPTGEQRPGGPPPSCNVCHVDRDAAWTREVLADWRRERDAAPPR